MNKSAWYKIGEAVGLLILAICWFICGRMYGRMDNDPRNLAVWADEHSQIIYIMTKDGNVYTHNYYFER